MMASVMGTVSMIRRIMRLRQMLRNWRNKARYSPHGVPAGHVAIVAGREGCDRRFVVRATYLNHPVFAKLLSEVEEEYGFGYDGPLTIPCDESAFEDVIRIVSGYGQDIGCGKAGELPLLLHGFVQKPAVW